MRQFQPVTSPTGTYFVAGGTSGIGRECTKRLLELGHEVVVAGLSKEHSSATREEFSGFDDQLIVFHGDLCDPAIAADIVERSGDSPLAGLVNAVGTIGIGGLVEESYPSWRRTLTTNLDAAFLLSKLLLPRLRRHEGSGIVNISSTCSTRPCNSLSYSVSKAALDMFTRGAARELSPLGVRVNSVNPGVFRSNLQLSAGVFETASQYEEWLSSMDSLHPLGIGTVEDVCAAVLFLLSPEARWITGAIMHVDGGRAAG